MPENGTAAGSFEPAAETHQNRTSNPTVPAPVVAVTAPAVNVLRPDFLKVLPADVAEHGWGAFILALVRFATAIDDGRYGRMMIDGAVWWRVSYADIAASLGGADRQKVGREIVKLEAASKLDSLAFADAEQSKAYRIPKAPDLPEFKSEPVLTCQSSNLNDTSSNMNCTSSNMNSALSLKEVKKGENGARERGAAPPRVSPMGNGEQQKQTQALDADGLPEPYCPAHMPYGSIDKCGPCGAADRIRKGAIAKRARYAERVKDELANVLADCHLCDEKGWLLGDDGTVDDRNLRCTHSKDGMEVGAW